MSLPTICPELDMILPTEWALHQDIVNHVLSLWGHSNVDLFATHYKCLNFVSPTPMPQMPELSMQTERACLHMLFPLSKFCRPQEFDQTQSCIYY